MQDLLISYKAMGCNMSLKIHFLESQLEIFARKSRRSQWRTRWKISPRHYGYGKAVPRQVGLKYVGGLLLNTEEGCTWSQIPAEVTSLYILEESFCLFHQYVSYYFAHLTLILLTWWIWWTPNNASRWQMGFNWAFNTLRTGSFKLFKRPLPVF